MLPAAFRQKLQSRAVAISGIRITAKHPIRRSPRWVKSPGTKRCERRQVIAGLKLLENPTAERVDGPTANYYFGWVWIKRGLLEHRDTCKCPCRRAVSICFVFSDWHGKCVRHYIRGEGGYDGCASPQPNLNRHLADSSPTDQGDRGCVAGFVQRMFNIPFLCALTMWRPRLCAMADLRIFPFHLRNFKHLFAQLAPCVLLAVNVQQSADVPEIACRIIACLTA